MNSYLEKLLSNTVKEPPEEAVHNLATIAITLGGMLSQHGYSTYCNGKAITIRKAKPATDQSRDKIDIHLFPYGWKAVHRFLDNITDKGIEFWDIQQSGFIYFKTPHEAYRQAISWANDEELPLVYRTREELDKLTKGGD